MNNINSSLYCNEIIVRNSSANKYDHVQNERTFYFWKIKTYLKNKKYKRIGS